MTDDEAAETVAVLEAVAKRLRAAVLGVVTIPALTVAIDAMHLERIAALLRDEYETPTPWRPGDPTPDWARTRSEPAAETVAEAVRRLWFRSPAYRVGDNL